MTSGLDLICEINTEINFCLALYSKTGFEGRALLNWSLNKFCFENHQLFFFRKSCRQRWSRMVHGCFWSGTHSSDIHFLSNIMQLSDLWWHFWWDLHLWGIYHHCRPFYLFITFLNIFSKILTALCWVYIIKPILTGGAFSICLLITYLDTKIN